MPQRVHLRDYRLAEIAAARVIYKQAQKEEKRKLHSKYAAIFRDLDREEAIARNSPSSQLERLNDCEGAARSVHAEEAVMIKLKGRESSRDSPELKRFRRAWKCPQSPEDHAAKAKLEAPHTRSKWPDIAEACGVPFAITFGKGDVAYILGYSLPGVDKLKRQGKLRFQRSGHRTLTFLPADVRNFLENEHNEAAVRTTKSVGRVSKRLENEKSKDLVPPRRKGRGGSPKRAGP